MKVLTKDGAAELMQVDDLDWGLHQRAPQVHLAGAPHPIPVQAKAQIGLAKFLGYVLARDCGIYVYLSRWGQHPASEHLDVIYGYRRSAGEGRTLSEAPVHYFEPREGEQLVSVLCLLFFFGWDAWIFDASLKTIMRLTSDKGLEVRAAADSDIAAFAADPERYFAALAR